MTSSNEQVTATDQHARRLLPGTNVLLVAFIILTAVAGVILYLLPGHTATLFAWTIQPSITGTFLGGGYAAGLVLVVLSLRSGSWAQARLPLVTITVFAALTLLATLLHTDRFHFAASLPSARFAAWVWLAVYIAVPCGLVRQVWRQYRLAGRDRERRRSWPPAMVAILGAQGTVLAVAGVALFVAPVSAGSLWPWALTPLTAQMIGSWLLAFGTAAAVAVADPDVRRLRIGSIGYAFFALLQLIALARFPGQIRWTAPATAVYLPLLLSMLAIGIAGYLLSVREPKPPVEQKLPFQKSNSTAVRSASRWTS